MTEAELLERGAELIAKWQPRLRLLDWDLRMTVGPCDQDHGAESSIFHRERMAAVRVAPDFPKAIRDSAPAMDHRSDTNLLEDCVLHELLHVTEYPAVQVVSDEIEYLVGKPDQGIVGSPLRAGWREYREWWIDNMVRVLMAREVPADA